MEGLERNEAAVLKVGLPPKMGSFSWWFCMLVLKTTPKTGSLQRRHHIEATNCAARQTVSRRSLRQKGLGGCLVLWACAGRLLLVGSLRGTASPPFLCTLFEKCDEPLFRVISFTVIVTTWV